MINSFFKTVEKKQSNGMVQLDHQLTADELELILKLLAQTQFPVKDIQTLYVALLKLQEQHKLQINGRKES